MSKSEAICPEETVSFVRFDDHTCDTNDNSNVVMTTIGEGNIGDSGIGICKSPEIRSRPSEPVIGICKSPECRSRPSLEGSTIDLEPACVVLKIWLCNNWVLLPYIVMYITLSIGLTLFNKWLLAVHDFKFPILIVTVDFFAVFIFSVVICIICRKEIFESIWSPSKITFMQYCRNFLHVGFVTGADTLLTQCSLLFTSITMCEVIKAGIPVLVLLFGAIRQTGEPLTWTKLGIVMLISIGICLTTLGDITGSFVGMIFASGSTVCAALRLVFMEGLLQAENYNGEKINSFLALAYILPGAIISLVVMLPTLEGPHMMNSYYFRSEQGGGLGWTFMFLAIHLATAISLRIFEVFVISTSSALTICVVGVAKLVIEIVISTEFFGDSVTVVKALGVVIAIAGAAWYNFEKFQNFQNPDESLSTTNVSTPYGALVDKSAINYGTCIERTAGGGGLWLSSLNESNEEEDNFMRSASLKSGWPEAIELTVTGEEGSKHS